MVIVVDYKMKLELGVRTRENQRQWYGKRGLSLHGCYVVAKIADKEKVHEVLDLWCEDTKQDSWFTQSALDVIFSHLGAKYSGYTAYLFSGELQTFLCFNFECCLAILFKAFDKNLECQNVHISTPL